MNVNENNIRPDLPDIFEWNDYIGFTVQKSQQFIASRNHNLADTAAAGIEFQIAYSPQFPAVFHINHIFALQFGKKHIIFLLFYAFIIRNMLFSLK